MDLMNCSRRPLGKALVKMTQALQFQKNPALFVGRGAEPGLAPRASGRKERLGASAPRV